MASSDDKVKDPAKNIGPTDPLTQGDRLFSSSSNKSGTESFVSKKNQSDPQVSDRLKSAPSVPSRAPNPSQSFSSESSTRPRPVSVKPQSGNASESSALTGQKAGGDVRSQAVSQLTDIAKRRASGEITTKEAVKEAVDDAISIFLRTAIDAFIKAIPELVATVAGILLVILGFLIMNVIWFIGFFKPSFDVLHFYEKFIIAFINGVLIFIATVTVVLSVTVFCFSQGIAFDFLAKRGLLPPGLEFCQVVYDSIGGDSGSVTPKLGGGTGFGGDDPGKGGSCQINQGACQVGRFEAENAKSGCGWNADFMSRVCALESSNGNPKAASGTDKCDVMVTNPETGKKGYLSYSIGLFQINMISSADKTLFPECQGVVVPLDKTPGYPGDKLAGELGGCAVGPAKTAGGNTYCPLRKCGFPKGKDPVKAESDYWACYRALTNPDRNIANACKLYKGRNNSCDWAASSNTCAGKRVCP